VLTTTQGVHQPHHSMRPADQQRPDTNRFACPLPEGLPKACTPHLACSMAVEAGGVERARRAKGRGRGRRRGAAAPSHSHAKTQVSE